MNRKFGIEFDITIDIDVENYGYTTWCLVPGGGGGGGGG